LAKAFVVPATVNTNTPAIMTLMSRPTIAILPFTVPGVPAS